MEDAYDYFEKYKQLPVVMVGEKGEYIINDVPPKKVKLVAEEKPKRQPVQHLTRNISTLADAVHQWPQYPGGGDALMKYLETLGKELTSILPEGVKRAYIQVEFIVDKDGVPVNFKVMKGVKNGEELHDILISRLVLNSAPAS